MLLLLVPTAPAIPAAADAEKRKIYDLYGEEGLKGVPPPGAAGPEAGGPGGAGFSGGYQFDEEVRLGCGLNEGWWLGLG